MNIQHRVIFFHTQSTSARTRFLYFNERDSVFGFSSLPALSVLIDEQDNSHRQEIAIKQRLDEVSAYIQSNIDDSLTRIQINPEFIYLIDAPQQLIVVSLVRFIDIDPPFEIAKKINTDFREITFLRSVPQVELALLQKVYQAIMG